VSEEEIMNSPFAVGIDLGTSTSEICVFRNNQPEPVPDPHSLSKSPIMPSLVAINSRGQLAVGEAARANVDREGMGVREVKRQMGSGAMVSLGGKQFRPEEISALILKQLKENAEASFGIIVRDVVLSVPANFSDAARQATKDAGELAGLKIMRLINEPTAAALAFGLKHIDVEEQLVVFDFGGGTLDITVLEMMAGVLDVKCSYGDPHLGGKDFDELMIQIIADKFHRQYPGTTITPKHRQLLKGAAEIAKISLSGQESHQVVLPNFAASRSGEPIDLEVEIHRGEFERAATPLLDRARACIRQTLQAKDIRPSAINRILLIGGTTYIPVVKRTVAEMFGKEPQVAVNPDLAVAMGAAIEAAILSNQIDSSESIVRTDVSPFGLGVDMITEIGAHHMLVYDPLIMPNTTIPYSTKKQYYLLHEEQDEVEFHVYQDHTGKAKFPHEAIDIGLSGRIINIPPSYSGSSHEVEVEFSYDVNGIIRLLATIPATGQQVRITQDVTTLRLSDHDKQAAQQNVNELWQTNPSAKSHESIIQKATSMLEHLPPPKRAQLVEMIDTLKQELVQGDEKRIQTASDNLVDLLFDLVN